MTLILSEQDVREVLDAPAVHAAVRSALSAGTGTLSIPRMRITGHDTGLNVLPGAFGIDSGQSGFLGVKTYAVTDHGVDHLVCLYSATNGNLTALVSATLLGAMRTGAVSAVATEYLHGPARVLACLGAGTQAEHQVRALVALGPPEQVRLASRTPARTGDLAARLTADLDGVAVVACASYSEALEGADVICTATRAARPILTERPGDGCHINAVGSNALDRAEVAAPVVAGADVVVEDRTQARLEAGDLVAALRDDPRAWDDLVELSTVVADPARWRRRHPISLFKSLGTGAMDIAVAAVAAERARDRGIGIDIPLAGNT